MAETAEQIKARLREELKRIGLEAFMKKYGLTKEQAETYH